MSIGNRNLSKLFLITVSGILLSLFMFYKGMEQETAQNAAAASPDPSFPGELFGSTPPLPIPSIGGPDNPLASPVSNLEEKNMVQVTKVVDGDTIEVMIEGREESVRLIGIDTPETVDPRRPMGCFGKEASNQAKAMLTGKQVILIKDVSERDKYDRLLRYVYVPMENNQLLFMNDYLVREGFAQVLTYPPDIKFNEQFLEAEKSAREGKKGLWGKCS